MTRLFQGMRPASARLTLLLLLVVVAPSACLLWFMTEAVQNERLAVRQKLTEAYRLHLAAAQQRLEAWYKQTARDLDAQANSTPPGALFAALVRSNLADAALCFDASNRLVYPAAPAFENALHVEGWQHAEELESTDPEAAAAEFARLAQGRTNLNLAASALQAQARCLSRASHPDDALRILLGPLTEDRYRSATDFHSRLIAPNAQLTAIEFLKNSNPTQADAIFEQLKSRLLNYDSADLSGSQRRFVMHELQTLFPGKVWFPTLAAEDLAASFLATARIPAAEAFIRETALPGVWRFDSANGRIVTLHHLDALIARLHRAAGLDEALPDTSTAFVPPGGESQKSLLSVPVGPSMPGWRLTLAVNDPQWLNSTANHRISSYLWIGLFMIAVVLLLGSLALGLMRRQLALTRLRNELVANVTHELKTPLASMRLLVDTLLDSARLEESTTREYLQLIARENNRLSRLIDNFLAFSRMERNKRTFEFANVPAENLVQDAATAVRDRFDSPDCRFQVHVAPGLPSVKADPDAMVTALVNLLDNAFKYSGDHKQISMSAAAENGCVRFCVKDNGVGLSPRDTRRIFDRFYQVAQPSARTAGGCGLGLSIVKFIVTAHHGEIHVDSRLGQGSTFTITLPAQPLTGAA